MSKPFNAELARKSAEKTREFVDKLNKFLSRFTAKIGPLKDHDISLVCKANTAIEVYVELEVVRSDRWEKIRSKYPTVRWPIAKKEKCEDYIKKNRVLIMMSVDENLTEMFFIECAEWVKRGHEEKAPFVKAGGKAYRYRKGGEERFWSIGKNEVIWCKVEEGQQLEEYVLKALEKSGQMCGDT